MPDFQQLAVLALALVPGFIAGDVQSFVALRRRPPALETTLQAIAYSAILYLATTIGQWGPQFDPDFAALVEGGEGALLGALTDPTVLLRYLALIAAAVILGFVTGRSLARGWARRIVAILSGRNVVGSTWQGFFRDSPARAVWVELDDSRRIIGEVTAASDHTDEQVFILAWPHILGTDGKPVRMNLDRLMIDADRCRLIALLPQEFVPKRDHTQREKLMAWFRERY